MVEPAETRRQLHGWVSPAAYAGFQQFAEDSDTNVTALLEAIGQALADATKATSAERKVFGDLAARAQRIAGARSARRRT